MLVWESESRLDPTLLERLDELTILARSENQVVLLISDFDSVRRVRISDVISQLEGLGFDVRHSLAPAAVLEIGRNVTYPEGEKSTAELIASHLPPPVNVFPALDPRMEHVTIMWSVDHQNVLVLTPRRDERWSAAIDALPVENVSVPGGCARDRLTVSETDEAWGMELQGQLGDVLPHLELTVVPPGDPLLTEHRAYLCLARGDE